MNKQDFEKILKVNNIKKYNHYFYSNTEQIYPNFLLYLTNRCNLNCYYCVTSEHRKLNKIFTPIDTIKDFIKSTKNLKQYDVSFMGGEPTLHPQFKEILQLLYNEPNNYISLLSNGSIPLKNKLILDVNNKFNIQITYHSTQMNEKLDKNFIENIKFLKQNNFDFNISFTFTDNKSKKMYNLLKYDLLKYDYKKYLFQIYIDCDYQNKIENNCDCDGFIFNGKFFTLSQILKIKFFRFKNWLCYDNIINVYEDGHYDQYCGSLNGHLKDTAFNDYFQFIKCNRNKCDHLCGLCKVKIK